MCGPHTGALFGAGVCHVAPIMKLLRPTLGRGLEAMPAPPGHRCTVVTWANGVISSILPFSSFCRLQSPV